MTLSSPWFLALLIPTAIVFWLLAKGILGREPTLLFSYLPLLRKSEVKHRKFDAWQRWHLLRRFGPIVLFIIALTRPQTAEVDSQPVGQATEFVFIVDTSVSMQTQMLGKESRLAEVEKQIGYFVQGRSYDSFGLVAFSGTPMLLCPVTSDHDFFLGQLSKITNGPGGEGRWYGAAIASALNHLTNYKERKSVAILISDGSDASNSEIKTEDAWKVAREMGVVIYAVGVGVGAEDIIPHEEPKYRSEAGVMDERTLFQVAKRTGGIYYHARDLAALEKVFKEIHFLEDYQFTTTTVRHPREHYFWVTVAGLVWLVLSTLIDRVFLRKLP